MSFWLFDPTSFKTAAVFPTGGAGNFLSTLTLAIIAFVVALKTKFKDILSDKKLFMYSGLALTLVTTAGYLFCRNESSNSIQPMLNFDLTYE
jgi:hypothetical protein